MDAGGWAQWALQGQNNRQNQMSRGSLSLNPNQKTPDPCTENNNTRTNLWVHRIQQNHHHYHHHRHSNQ
jgi:hypothetical protein